MELSEEVKAMSKAQFAVNILKEYAEKENTTIRGTTDLSPLEEWLILRLKVKEEALLFNAKVNVDLIRKNHELLSKAGWVKKEEWIPIKDAEKFFNDFYGKYVTVLCPIYNRATKLMSWEMYHVEIDNNGDLFYADGSGDCGITYKDVDFYRLENFPPLPSPPQNKEQ